MLSRSQTTTAPKLDLSGIEMTEAINTQLLTHQINNINRYYARKLYLFLAQLFISVVVIAFCIVQLVLTDAKESLYIAIMMGIVGTWLGQSKYLIKK